MSFRVGERVVLTLEYDPDSKAPYGTIIDIANDGKSLRNSVRWQDYEDDDLVHDRVMGVMIQHGHGDYQLESIDRLSREELLTHRNPLVRALGKN